MGPSGAMIFSAPATVILTRLKCASATNTIIRKRIRQRTAVLLGTKTPAEDHDEPAPNRVYRWKSRRTAEGPGCDANTSRPGRWPRPARKRGFGGSHAYETRLP